MNGSPAPAAVIARQVLDRRIFTTERTCGISVDDECSEIRLEAVVNKKPSHEGIPFFQNEFQRFSGLNQADLPGDNPQDSNLASGGGGACLRYFRDHTAQTRAAVFRIKNTCLPVESDSAPEDVGFA